VYRTPCHFITSHEVQFFFGKVTVTIPSSSLSSTVGRFAASSSSPLLSPSALSLTQPYIFSLVLPLRQQQDLLLNAHNWRHDGLSSAWLAHSREVVHFARRHLAPQWPSSSDGLAPSLMRDILCSQGACGRMVKAMLHRRFARSRRSRYVPIGTLPDCTIARAHVFQSHDSL
jgi:hypothetical protein